MDSVAAAICFDCEPEVLARCCARACVWRAALSICTEDWLIATTRPRSDSTAMFTESAMAPVMSSVTVAVAGRSPCPGPAISSSRRRMAAWLRSLSMRWASTAWRATAASCITTRMDLYSIASGASAIRHSSAAISPGVVPENTPTAAPASASAAAVTTRISPREDDDVEASCCGIEEPRVFEQLAQAQHRPGFFATTESAGHESFAADDGRRRIAAEFSVGEAPESQHFIHHQARRHIAMAHHEQAGVAGQRRDAAAQELSKVDHRQQRAAQVAQALHPGFRPRHARELRRIGQHFARFLARHEVTLAGHAPGHADPLTGAVGILGLDATGGLAATVKRDQQVVRFLAQAADGGGSVHWLRASDSQRCLGFLYQQLRGDRLDHVVDGALAQSPHPVGLQALGAH